MPSLLQKTLEPLKLLQDCRVPEMVLQMRIGTVLAAVSLLELQVARLLEQLV